MATRVVANEELGPSFDGADVIRVPATVGIIRAGDCAVVQKQGGLLRMRSDQVVKASVPVVRMPELPAGQTWKYRDGELEAWLRPPNEANRQEATPEEDELPSEPPEFQSDCGSAPAHLPGKEQEAVDNWVWIRKQNDEGARSARRRIAALTRQATAAAGYVLKGTHVSLSCVDAMCSGTRAMAPSLGNVGLPAPSSEFSETTLRKMPFNVVALEAAVKLSLEPWYNEGKAVAVVSAASAYHCGGGFLTGGRHALEEAICVQTTLHASISQEWLSALEAAEEAAQGGRFAYFPQDAAVLSPRVELFREGTSQGYSFMARPVELAAVISVAMFNQNASVGDAPLDAPEDEAEYERVVADKFRSALAAAVSAGATALVMPDVGCGVYMNDPEVVGRIFGTVLRREYWGHLREVALCGKRQFQDAVESAVEQAGRRASRASEPEDDALKALPSNLREDMERKQREKEMEQRRFEKFQKEKRELQEELQRKQQEDRKRQAEIEAEEERRRQKQEELRAEQERKEEEQRQKRAREAARRQQEAARKAQEAEERRQRAAEEIHHGSGAASSTVSPRPQMLQLVVPAGVMPGMQLQVQTPDGQVLQVGIPPGIGPGQTLQVQYTPLAAAGAGVGAVGATWEWHLSDDRWRPYEARFQEHIEHAYQAFVRGGGDAETSLPGEAGTVVINFADMQQHKEGRDQKRRVRRMNV